MPRIRYRSAVCKEDTEKRKPVATDDTHQRPGHILEPSSGKDACIEPQNRELNKDCAQEPCNAAYYYKLMGLSQLTSGRREVIQTLYCTPSSYLSSSKVCAPKPLAIAHHVAPSRVTVLTWDSGK